MFYFLLNYIPFLLHTPLKLIIKPTELKVSIHKYLLVSVATIVMLCHIFVSLSSGVAKVIFPSSALMLNCLSRSVCRSMENLQNRHPCNLLNEVGVIHTITRQFREPCESCSFTAKWIKKLDSIIIYKTKWQTQTKKTIIIIAQGVIRCIPSVKVIKCPQVHWVTSLKNGADQELITQSITFIRQFLWYFTVTDDNFDFMDFMVIFKRAE